ncbi:DUF1800 family protein [Emticicia sp. CRIBPO]|uniref:DUF1800 domain-containing protein n=1 Tax=Emticicia sp. CRIBPO TaxID=2683258 RepID=UPI0014136861|nr:DUF1800 domain-containing protein [Emticicia sp. CRIBPO]NBA87105.1 DUF1800 family protein [Emticicia sp. CRIBPO]
MSKFTSSGAGTYQGVWGDVQKRHLLNRTMFGATAEDINYFSSFTLEKMVGELLTQGPVPAPPLNFYQNVYPDPHQIKSGETWINAPFGDGTINARRKLSLKLWWVQNMWFQKRSVEEKMILFWHNHFVTEMDTYTVAQMGFRYQDTLRKYALGNFKAMVKAVTIEPAMLEYLNGAKNSKSHPDENYGRELQELFTLGKGAGSGYTEDDVKQAARVLTGHRFERVNFTHTFSANDHDTADKQFSSFYGNKVIKGITGKEGALELDDMLNMIFEEEEVSKFIVRKLYRFFVYYDITEDIENNFISPLAGIFREGGYEIKPVLKALFKSEHFYDSGLFGAMITSPLDFTLKTVRKFGVKLPSQKTNIYENYVLTEYIRGTSENCQQNIADPPGVAGWPAYWQAPLFHEIWINSDTFQKRIGFIESFFQSKFYTNGFRLEVNLPEYTTKLKHPENPDLLIEEICSIFLEIMPSKDLRSRLKTDVLLSGQSSDYYWTELWENYLRNPLADNYRYMVLDRLKKLYEYILSLPEYQLS